MISIAVITLPKICLIYALCGGGKLVMMFVLVALSVVLQFVLVSRRNSGQRDRLYVQKGYVMISEHPCIGAYLVRVGRFFSGTFQYTVQYMCRVYVALNVERLFCTSGSFDGARVEEGRARSHLPSRGLFPRSCSWLRCSPNQSAIETLSCMTS